MGKIRKKYDVRFKKKVVDFYLKKVMGYETVEKRGKAKGPNKGRPRIRPEDSETQIKRVKAEVGMLKKFLTM